MTVVQIIVGNLAAFSPIASGILSILSTGIYAVFYFIAVKAPFSKTFFTLLMLSNMANLVITAAKCLEGHLFGVEIAVQAYRFSYSIYMVIFHILITLPLFFYIKKFMYKVMEINTIKSIWNYVGLFPQHSILYGITIYTEVNNHLLKSHLIHSIPSFFSLLI